MPGTARVLPGYPTLRTLGVTAALKMAAVEVLGMPSKKESLILTVKVGHISCTEDPRHHQAMLHGQLD